MKETISNGQYDTKIETSDWRYNASIVGLMRFFDYLYYIGEAANTEDLYRVYDDIIEYDSNAITEARYLLFAEDYFKDKMHHKVAEEILSGDEFTEEQIKLVNDKLKANSIMSKVFGGVKFSGENKGEILKLTEENKLVLIKETYRNGDSLYKNFSNIHKLFSEAGDICRLVNYYTDLGRKSKSASYNWDIKTYSFKDDEVFDFIPFAFSKSYESFFINNSYTVEQLFKANEIGVSSENFRTTLFGDMGKSAGFIDFDVEIIVKNRGNDYFETLYIRKYAIKIFSNIKNYNAIQRRYKINDNYYIDIEHEAVNSILNNIRLDKYIEILLKEAKGYTHTVNTLIEINILIYGGDKMDRQMKSAYGSAKKVMAKIPDNKVNSYKQKLISSITFKDYERFCEILLQLSSYSGIVFGFAYDLFSDFEENKNIAYTFINALNKEENRETDKKNGGE